MASTAVTVEGIKSLSEHTELRSVMVTQTLGDEIATLAPKWSKLEKVCMRCGVGDTTAKALGEACASLRCVDLCGSKVHACNKILF